MVSTTKRVLSDASSMNTQGSADVGPQARRSSRLRLATPSEPRKPQLRAPTRCPKRLLRQTCNRTRCPNGPRRRGPLTFGHGVRKHFATGDLFGMCPCRIRRQTSLQILCPNGPRRRKASLSEHSVRKDFTTGDLFGHGVQIEFAARSLFGQGVRIDFPTQHRQPTWTRCP